MHEIINIGIAEDHLLTRQGMVALLKEFDNVKILFDVSNGREALDCLKSSVPDIILLDIDMPVMNGREFFEKMKRKFPKVKVIIISQHFKDSFIIEFIRKGACGFLNKNCGIEKLMDALHSVHENGSYYDSTVALIMAKTIKNNTELQVEEIPSETNLTPREIQLIRLVCLNKSNKEIADFLSISVRTVEGHRLHIMNKTKCKTLLELITYALQNNLVIIS